MTYYQVLGVSKNASQEEIRDAYKKLVKKYHPDLYQGDKSFAEKKTKEINEAYDVLSDADKRASYNLEIDPPTYTAPDYSGYQYTPPKYSSSNYDTYESYRTKYGAAGSYADRYNTKTSTDYASYRNTYNEYANSSAKSTYEYQKRYSDYHRSKTPNSNYTDNTNLVYSNVSQYVSIFFMIVIVYIAIFVVTFAQYQDFTKQSKQQVTSIPITNTTNTTNSTNNSSLDPSEKEFNINDYYSDSELRQMYYERFSNMFDSFEDFKETFSEYAEMYLSF